MSSVRAFGVFLWGFVSGTVAFGIRAYVEGVG